MSEIEREQERAAEPARPKRRRRALWVALPVAAALVAGAVTYTARDDDGAGDVIGTPMAASPAQFLRQVSVRAEELPVPRADQFIYQRTVSTFRPMTEEEWEEYSEEHGLTVTRSTGDGNWETVVGLEDALPDVRFIWTEVGRPMGVATEPYETERWISPDGTTGWTINPYDLMNTDGEGVPIANEPWEPYLEGTNYEYLSELPTDAEGLRDVVYGEFGEQDGLTGEALEQRVFSGFGSLAFQELLPPGLAAGLYEALGQVPGVELLEGIEDAAGRTVVGVGRLDQDTGIRCTYLFDPETYDLLGYQEVQVEEQDGVAVGTLLDNQAILERGVVDEARQRPGEGSGAA
ncbi:CU044_5270 family protein [Streptomyces sp. NPDC049879]|uniref:CU044_5270 family protein n=1 Tax=Streptomyces sp. NPDC049879 TaxID=3365598 RepID=UPI003787E206